MHFCQNMESTCTTSIWFFFLNMELLKRKVKFHFLWNFFTEYFYFFFFFYILFLYCFNKSHVDVLLTILNQWIWPSLDLNKRYGEAATADQHILLSSSQAGVAVDSVPRVCTEEQSYCAKNSNKYCFGLTAMKIWRPMFGCILLDVLNAFPHVGCTVADSSVDSCSPSHVDY